MKKENKILIPLLIIITCISILLGIYAVYSSIKSHDSKCNDNYEDNLLKECNCQDNPVTNEEISLLNLLINDDLYNTYINLNFAITSFDDKDGLKPPFINSPYGINYIIGSMPTVESVNEIEGVPDSYNDFGGYYKIKYDIFIKGIEALTGKKYDTNIIKDYIYGDYIYINKPTDSLYQILIIDKVSKKDGKYVLILKKKDFDDTPKIEVTIRTDIENLKLFDQYLIPDFPNIVIENVKEAE